MSQERKQILQMLSEGRISADDAERLLDALGSDARNSDSDNPAGDSGKKPKFLHVKVHSEPGGHHKHENVDIKIPIMLMKAGLKLKSLVPEHARDKFSSHLSDHGINLDLDRMDSESIDQLLQTLTETSIDVDADHEKIRIFCS